MAINIIHDPRERISVLQDTTTGRALPLVIAGSKSRAVEFLDYARRLVGDRLERLDEDSLNELFEDFLVEFEEFET